MSSYVIRESTMQELGAKIRGRAGVADPVAFQELVHLVDSISGAGYLVMESEYFLEHTIAQEETVVAIGGDQAGAVMTALQEGDLEGMTAADGTICLIAEVA